MWDITSNLVLHKGKNNEIKFNNQWLMKDGDYDYEETWWLPEEDVRKVYEFYEQNKQQLDQNGEIGPLDVTLIREIIVTREEYLDYSYAGIYAGTYKYKDAVFEEYTAKAYVINAWETLTTLVLECEFVGIEEKD